MRQPNTRTGRITVLCITGLMMASWLIACSSPFSPKESKPSHSYLLEWQPEPAVAKTPSADAPTLLVSATRAAAGYGSSDMLYVEQPHRLAHFANHRWADTPARMLDPLLIQACDHSGLFRAVTGPGKQLQTTLRLDSELQSLQQVFETDSRRIELSLRVSLVEIDSGRLLATQNFTLSESVTEGTPYAGVLAANRAVGRLLKQLQDFLAAQVKNRRTAD